MKTNITVEIRSIDNKWAVTIERNGSTLRISKSFDTEEEAIQHAKQIVSEYVP